MRITFASSILVFPSIRISLPKIILIVINLFILLTSTGQPTFESPDYQTVEQSDFVIKVPDYLVEVNDMSFDAELQMKNVFAEAYFMIASEEKAKSHYLNINELQNEFEVILESSGGYLSSVSEKVINGRKAFQSQALYEVDGILFRYLITFIDTPGKIFKLYSWTTQSNEVLLNSFVYSSNSFKLVNWQPPVGKGEGK